MFAGIHIYVFTYNRQWTLIHKEKVPFSTDFPYWTRMDFWEKTYTILFYFFNSTSVNADLFVSSAECFVLDPVFKHFFRYFWKIVTKIEENVGRY